MAIPSEELQDVMRVLSLIEGGDMPTIACDNAGVSYSAFCKWTERLPQLGELRREAEMRLHDRLAETLLTIHTDERYGSSDPRIANVISANIKWLLERLAQSKYGSKSTVEVTIKADREVLDALSRAKERSQGGGVLAIEHAAVEKIVTDLIVLDNGLAMTPEDHAEYLALR